MINLKILSKEFKFNGFDIWHRGNFNPDNKVDKISGKGLSTNDYTTSEKNKLAGIEANANNYSLPGTLPASMITGLPASLPANGGNADTVDSYHAGNSAGQIPVSNGSLNTNLNSDKLDNQEGVYYLSRTNHTGNQPSSTISDFSSTVLSTILTGLSATTNTAISTSDNVLSALGKLQKQIADHLADAVKHITSTERTNWNSAKTHADSSHAPSNAQKNSDIAKAEIEAKLTGTITTHNHIVTKSDVGLGNVTNESKSTMFSSPDFTGTPTAPTQAAGNNSTRIATTAFVQTALPTKLSQLQNDIGAGGGINIVVSPTQPSISAGDWWFQEL